MDVRHALTKHGGNLGTDGSVAFLFKHCGQIVFEPGVSEDAVMEVALEAGAEDIVTDEDGSIEVLTPPADFLVVKEALEAAGLKPAMAEVTMKPTMETVFTGDDAVKMQKFWICWKTWMMCRMSIRRPSSRKVSPTAHREAETAKAHRG